MSNILIVDDDVMFCKALSRSVEGMGYKVSYVNAIEEAQREAVTGAFDVIYLDVHMPDGNGLDVLPAMRNSPSSPEIIIMTGSGDSDGAELAIKSGAWDYIEKPTSLNTMLLSLVRALQYREAKIAQIPVTALKREGIIGSSAPMRLCLDYVAQAACSDTNILVTGETGTGKELIAWAIHHNSTRSDGNFVVVDCASLTETLVESMLFGHEKGAYTGADKANCGLIKQADGGTLFLDEVGELPLSIQKSFLRVLQERRFRPLGSKHEVKSNFRLVAATNRNLDQRVKDGQFRSDLLFRLRSFIIDLPPLRNRREDIVELVTYHMTKLCERYCTQMKGFSPEFLEALIQYDWPGNVRELVLTLERVLAVARNEPVLFQKHLPTNIRVQIARDSIGKPASASKPVAEKPDAGFSKLQDIREEAISKAEKDYLQNILAFAGNDIKLVCQLSGLSRSRIYGLLKKYAINNST